MVECCGTSSTSSKVSAVTMPVSISLSVSSGVLSSICDSTRRRGWPASAPIDAKARLGGGAVTLLVFPAAAARTRVVSPDLRFFPLERLDDVVAAHARGLIPAGPARHRHVGLRHRGR